MKSRPTERAHHQHHGKGLPCGGSHGRPALLALHADGRAGGGRGAELMDGLRGQGRGKEYGMDADGGDRRKLKKCDKNGTEGKIADTKLRKS